MITMKMKLAFGRVNEKFSSDDSDRLSKGVARGGPRMRARGHDYYAAVVTPFPIFEKLPTGLEKQNAYQPLLKNMLVVSSDLYLSHGNLAVS
jgi:hypothetical protein